ATGRAIITTDTPGCRETVETGGNGFLVPPRDAKALAEAMIRLGRNPQLVRRMGQRSREIAAERFDVIKVNDLLADEMGRSHKQAALTSLPPTRSSLGDLPLLELPLAAILAIISLPLVAVIALAVLLTMGRPVLYVQARVGRDGKVFPLVKFRSMVTMNDAD